MPYDLRYRTSIAPKPLPLGLTFSSMFVVLLDRSTQQKIVMGFTLTILFFFLFLVCFSITYYLSVLQIIHIIGSTDGLRLSRVVIIALLIIRFGGISKSASFVVSVCFHQFSSNFPFNPTHTNSSNHTVVYFCPGSF